MTTRTGSRCRRQFRAALLLGMLMSLGACDGSSAGDAGLQARLTGTVDRYLEARNSVVTDFGGDGIDPSVPMTDRFRAELECELLEIGRFGDGTFGYSTTALRVLAFSVEDRTATVDVNEHTRLAIQPEEGAPPFSEYGVERRFGFVLSDGEWLLDADDVIGEEGSLPETMVPAGTC